MTQTPEQLQQQVSKYYTRWQKAKDKLKDSEYALAQTQEALTERELEAKMLMQEATMLRKENNRLAGLLQDLQMHFPSAPSQPKKPASVSSRRVVTIPLTDSEDEAEEEVVHHEEDDDDEEDDEEDYYDKPELKAPSKKPKASTFTFGPTDSASASTKPSSSKGDKSSRQSRSGDVFKHDMGEDTYRRVNFDMSGFVPSRPERGHRSEQEDSESEEDETPICRFYNTPAGCKHGKKCKFRHVKEHPSTRNRQSTRRPGQASGGKSKGPSKKGHTHHSNNSNNGRSNYGNNGRSNHSNQKKSGSGSARARPQSGNQKKSGRGKDTREKKSSSGKKKKKSGHGTRRSHHQSRC